MSGKEEEGFVEELRKLEEEIDREIHQHNLFPLMAGGLSVFFLMVSMVVAMPFMFYTSVPSERAHVYTTLEYEGRKLYLSLGCFYCHSQFVRPTDWAIGNTSLSGDYVYDNPHSLGTERTGPDLSQIGGMRPTYWHYFHDVDPRSTSPHSIMPNFDFLTDGQLESLVAYINYVGEQNLETMDFMPTAPQEYLDKSNPYTPLMTEVSQQYDPENDNYTGDPSLGGEWATLFDDGKAMFTKVCISCHGCSGNSQGPYARHVLTKPANLNERIKQYPGEYYHFYRVSEGVPGTAMPTWKLTFNETERWMIITYETSFVLGSIRTIPGDVSDQEGDDFARRTGITPPINGTEEDYTRGQNLYDLFCAQCHGVEGHGDGPASIATPGGYIRPEPANFTESGSDFQLYGRYVWKVMEGVETTNMPPWKYALLEGDIYRVIFYVQAFSTPEDWNSKWGPEYSDPFARNLKR